MPKTKIKSIILFTAMVLVVSGCSSQLKIKNEELGIKDSGEMGGLVEQVATTTGEDLGVASGSEEVDISDWWVYRNERFGFEMLMPSDHHQLKYGLGGITDEEGEKYMHSHIDLYGTDSWSSQIGLYLCDRTDQDVAKVDLSSPIVNNYGVEYYYSDVYSNGESVNLFVVGEKKDDEFICINIKTDGSKNKQYFAKIIENFKKINR